MVEDDNNSEVHEWRGNPARDLWEDPSRDRGILTETDREFLLGNKDLSGQDERNARYRIRQRVVQGLLDIGLLMGGLKPQDMRQIAQDDRLSGSVVPASMIALVSELAYHRDLKDPVREIEFWIEDGMRMSPPKRKDSMDGEVELAEANPTVSIEWEWDPVPVDELLTDDMAQQLFGKSLDEVSEEGLSTEERENFSEILVEAIDDRLDTE